MPAKITFTQKEQDAVKEAYLILKEYDSTTVCAELKKLLDKMEKARTKESTAFHGVGVTKVMQMAEEKFGDRFKKPTLITGQWTIKMQKAINDSGVSEETARKAIDNCDWIGDVYAQTLIYKLAELAVVKNKPRQGKLFGPAAPTKKSGWLGQLNDD